MTALLEVREARKSFGGVHAVDGVSLSLAPGEVLAVLGHNGAGKSTLMQMLAGALPFDGGEVRLSGQAVKFASPADSRAAGIETIHQKLALADNLDSVANLFLGRELRRPGLFGSALRMLDKKKMLEESVARMAELKVGIRSMTLCDSEEIVDSMVAMFGGRGA